MPHSSRSHHRETPTHRNKSSPGSPQLGKAPTQQGEPCASINKQTKARRDPQRDPEIQTIDWYHSDVGCFGEGNGNPLQYSCLQNPMDRRAWWLLLGLLAKIKCRRAWWATQSMGSQTVGQDWVTNRHTLPFSSLFWVWFCRSFSSLVFLDYISPFNSFCKAGLVVIFYLSEELLISPINFEWDPCWVE